MVVFSFLVFSGIMIVACALSCFVGTQNDYEIQHGFVACVNELSCSIDEQIYYGTNELEEGLVKNDCKLHKMDLPGVKPTIKCTCFNANCNNPLLAL